MRRLDFGACAAIEQNAHCIRTFRDVIDKAEKLFTPQTYRSRARLSPLENSNFSQEKIRPAGTSNGNTGYTSQIIAMKYRFANYEFDEDLRQLRRPDGSSRHLRPQ